MNAASVVRHERCWRVPSLQEVVMYEGHYNQNFIPHMHDVVTILLVTEGSSHVDLRDDGHTVGPGELLLIGAGILHAAHPLTAGGWHMRSLHVPRNAVAPLLTCGSRETLQFVAPKTSDRAITSDFHVLHDLRRSAEKDRLIDGIRAYLGLLQRQLDMFQPRVIQSARTARIESILQAMLQTAFDECLIEELAEELGISAFTLIRTLKKHLGISPHAWRIQTRVGEATRQLQSGLSPADVAARCGLFDQAQAS